MSSDFDHTRPVADDAASSHPNRRNFQDLDLAAPRTGDDAGSQEGHAPVADAADDDAAPQGSPDESVFGIIADVERKLHRIRSAQQQTEEKLISLDERSRALDTAEAALHAQRDELAAQLESLKTAREQVEQDSRSLAAERQGIDERAAKLSGDEEALEGLRALVEEDRASVEAQKSDLAKREQEIESQRQALAAEREAASDRGGELEARIGELDAELRNLRSELESSASELAEVTAERDSLRSERQTLIERMDKAERNVGDLIEQLEVTQNELEAKIESSEALEARAAEMQSQAASLRKRLDEAAQQLEALQAEGAEQAAAARRERDTAVEQVRVQEKRIAEVEKESKALAADVAKAKQEAEAARSAADASDQRISELKEAQAGAEKALRVSREEQAQLEGQLEELRSLIAAKEETIAQQRKTLDAAKEKLAEFVEAIGEQTEQIQQGMAAIAEVREQKKQIERLKEELAKAKMAGNPEEWARKEQRIVELTEALRQARGQSIADDDISEREERIETLEGEIDQLRNELERARVEAAEARKELEDHRADVQPSDDSETTIALQARIRELEAALIDAQAQASAGGGEKNNAYAEELRRKAKILKQAAEHLRRRKSRLERVHHLLEQRSASTPGRTAAAPAEVEITGQPSKRQIHEEREQIMRLKAQIDAEKANLNETTRALAASEKAMIRKWARPRAVVTMTWFMATLAVLAAGAWFAADHFFPALRAAEARIVAEPRPGFPLSDEERRSWQSWHEALLTNDAFLRTAAKRFDDRRFDHIADPYDLKQYLSNHLTTDSTTNGELVLTLAGRDAEATRTTLDLLSLTIVAESRRQAAQRTDSARTAIAGEYKDRGQARYATITPSAIKDERLNYAAGIFGGMALVAIIFIALIYSKLSRAKRIFEQDGDISLLQAMGA